MLFSEVTRKQAFLTHLSVSSIIFFALCYLIVFEWYPSYYFDIDGGIRGLATIFFVDVVLGPGLTLLVFKQGKKGLKFDMAMILIFQIVALSWGIKSVYESRPAATVFFNGRFVCITYEDIDESQVESLRIHDAGPVLAFLKRPDTYDGFLEYTMTARQADSAEIYYYSDDYMSMGDFARERIASYRNTIDADLIEMDDQPELRERYEANWVAYLAEGPHDDAVRLIPLSCRYGYVTAKFNTETGTIEDTIGVFTRSAESSIPLRSIYELKPELLESVD